MNRRKNHGQTESSTELDEVALRGCSIYTDPQVPPPEKINNDDLAETTKNAQTNSSSELDAVALKGCSIYTDPQVPPAMKSEVRNQKSELSNSENIGNINIDRTNSNISLPDRVEGIIDNGKTSDFRLLTSEGERSDYVPPSENINTDDLVAPLLEQSEKLISLEIPTDEEPQPGDRVYSPITEQKGILQSFGSSYSSVIWDGTKTARSIYSHVIQKLEEVEVLRSELIDAVSSLRKIITNSKAIKLIKKLPENTIKAAIHWLRFQGKRIVGAIEQVFKRIDYEFYIELWS